MRFLRLAANPLDRERATPAVYTYVRTIILHVRFTVCRSSTYDFMMREAKKHTTTTFNFEECIEVQP
jgi:hypothetical protein